MPELPEVETVARRIREPIVGKRISSVTVLWQRTLGGMSVKKFTQLISGAEIVGVSRRAKYILIALNPGGYLVVHLRMSGDLWVQRKDEEKQKHLRVSLTLSDGYELRFVDTRKFGRFVFLENLDQLMSRLGPEPLDDPFDMDKFCETVHASRRVVKSVLLDQKMVAGLGNIYAIETLWRAQIHPLTPSNRLTRSKVESLVASAHEILIEAINSRGTDLGDGVWKTGGFEPAIYGRAGDPCHRCGNTIVKIRVAQRGTEFCAKCQPRKSVKGVSRRARFSRRARPV